MISLIKITHSMIKT